VPAPSPDQVDRARRELRGRLGIPADALVFGHLGQVLPHKGQLEFLAAVGGMRTARRACFALIGDTARDPAFARRLEARAAAPGSTRIALPGFVPDGAMALDVLAFTATAPDPFPLAVLEAMAAGVPVVAFALGGVPEAVIDGETGFLVAPEDVDGVARALDELVEDPALRGRLGFAAARRARERFPIERVADAYLEVLDEVAARG